MESLDHALFLKLNASDEPSRLLVLLASVFAKYVIILLPLHIALLWLGGNRRLRSTALMLVLALFVALSANYLIGVVAYTPRPFVIGLGNTLIEHRPSPSFPSNHGTIFFTYTAVLALIGARRLAWAVGVTGLTVAWARIYLGVHYPLDMAGAVLVSVAAALIARYAMGRWGDAILQRADALSAWLIPFTRKV